jgi:hypothetical protein
MTGSLGQWRPQDASDLGAYATLLASLVTLLLFVISWRQLRLLRDQVRLAAQETAAAQTSANAAQMSAQAAIDAATEATRARVDSYSPRLIVTVEVQPGAFVDASRSVMPGGDELRLLDPRSVQQSRTITYGEEFVFDRDQSLFIWFRVEGSVRNEGNATGKVSLGGEAHFAGTGHGEEVTLRPGNERAFEWAAGFTAATLADRRAEPQPARGFLEVTGSNYEDEGIIDKIHLELASRALQEVPGHRSTFVFSDQYDEALRLPATVAVAYPTQRIYRWDWEAGKIPPPPWPT